MSERAPSGGLTDVELVEKLVRTAVCCPCAHPRRIAIYYETGTPAQDHAQSVHAELRARRHDMLVTLRLGGLGAFEAPEPHFCAVFNASCGTA